MSWKTALILECGTGSTDRFMWPQEGREHPIIIAVKSPVRAALACRWNWVCECCEHPGLLARGWRCCWKELALQAGCKLNGMVRQQLADRKEREYRQRDEVSAGMKQRGMEVVKKEESDTTWSLSLSLCIDMNHWESLTHQRETSAADRPSVTACLSLLPLWHSSRSPLTTVSLSTCLSPQRHSRVKVGWEFPVDFTAYLVASQ